MNNAVIVNFFRRVYILSKKSIDLKNKTKQSSPASTRKMVNMIEIFKDVMLMIFKKMSMII